MDSTLHIDGIPVNELINNYGSPLYVYRAEKIVSQYQKLEKAFSDLNFRIKYACKSNNNINILKLLKNEGCGLDTVSINEVELGLKAGFEPNQIIYTPNCVSFEEIHQAVNYGVHINIDNISILEQFGNHYGNTVPVCIRINPHVLAGGNKNIQTGHIDSKFGISIHQMRHVERVIKALNIKLVGIHMHTGSDILSTDSFLLGLDILLETAIKFKGLQYIDFGSGFKVAYKEGDNTTDVEDLGRKVTKRFQEFCKEYGSELELWCEPGKYLVSESGSFLVTVSVVKQTVSTVFAGVDSGLNHLIRPMFYDAYHKIENASNTEGTERIYTIVGNICETDTFGWDRKMNEVKEGDILIMHNAGAYGFSMASNYNSRPRPAEVLIKEGKAHLIRRRETMEDVLSTTLDLGI